MGCEMKNQGNKKVPKFQIFFANMYTFDWNLFVQAKTYHKSIILL